MEKININLKNCYGIGSFNGNFDFSRCRSVIIYAPNGVMKTSFAKTFLDFSKNEQSKDLMYPNRVNIREIKNEDNLEIESKSVFVIEPYNEKIGNERVSTLLADNDLKERYNNIHLSIDTIKNELIKKLKQLSGRKKDIEEEINKCFGEKTVFNVLERLESQVNEGSDKFSSLIYNEIFNDDVIKFLETKNFKRKLRKYIDKYDELLGKSKFLKQGFDHYKAATIQTALKTQGFFKANHTVNLFDGHKKIEVLKEEDFENIINEEKNIILNDEALLKEWEEIDKKLSSKAELRSFRDYLFDNKEIIIELDNINNFKKQIWLSYFINQKEVFTNTLNEYKKGKIELAEIVLRAKEQKDEWKRVIDLFNQRFYVPFKIAIRNQEDVILQSAEPTIFFIFDDERRESQEEESSEVEKETLLKVLSQGEKRALYLLNIIFEVEARKKENQKTIFIVDDIADSFDYKNKYAIIQYLKEITDTPIFRQIILTHNFDFFRTIESRKVVSYSNCYFANKENQEISLKKAIGIKNPFINDWKSNLNDSKKLIASIPFVRNIIEYTKVKDNNYLKLTSLLHWKSDSDGIVIEDLKKIFCETIEDVVFPTIIDNHIITDLIFREAQDCLNASNGINLEHKIVLSIGIRLLAEKYMTLKINDTEFIESITANQTIELFKKFKSEFPNDSYALKILENVNLMTPENIHLNSFMYEPILDLSDYHLRDLYQKLENILEANVSSNPS